MRKILEIPDVLAVREELVTPAKRKMLLDRRQLDRVEGAWSEAERDAKVRK